tara:strand:+ start:1075 stop:1317 length:243 start_codon:yes stop_codon:yes gene_type:complete
MEVFMNTQNKIGWEIISDDDNRKRTRLKRRIVSTQILAEWSDSPKMKVLLHDMPTDLALQFDHWLEDIEAEENAKDRGGV